MSHLVFKLNGVPDDEAEDVRLLLEENEIAYYETDSGRFGLGSAAIWMRDDEKLEQAKEAIDEYQKLRCQRVRSEHEAMEEAGESISRLQFFMTSPIKFTILLIFAGALAYFTVIPFFKGL